MDKDFSDWLFDEQAASSADRDHKYQKDRIRALLEQIPAANHLSSIFSDSRNFLCLNSEEICLSKIEPWIDAFILDLDDQNTTSLQKLNQLRVECPNIVIVARSSVQDELSVLECRASGADTFVINTAVLTIEEIQYLVEVGRDFGMESILSVKSVDDFKKFQRIDTEMIIVEDLAVIGDIYLASNDKVIFYVDTWEDVGLVLDSELSGGLVFTNNLIDHPDFQNILSNTMET